MNAIVIKVLQYELYMKIISNLPGVEQNFENYHEWCKSLRNCSSFNRLFIYCIGLRKSGKRAKKIPINKKCHALIEKANIKY